MKQKIKLIAFALTLAMGLSSCIAAVAVAGAGGVAYWVHAKNQVTGEFRASFEATWEATLAELEAQGLGSPTGVEKGVTEGTLSSDGWTVRVERIAGDRTQVRVRIGTFDSNDHERRSQLLLEGIGRHLGTECIDPDAVEEVPTQASEEADEPT